MLMAGAILAHDLAVERPLDSVGTTQSGIHGDAGIGCAFA